MDKIITQAGDLFKTADFDYAVCGGFALDMFAGRELRPHGDFDMCFFVEDKQKVLQFLIDREWPIFGRFWEEGKNVTQFLFYQLNGANDPEFADIYGFWAVKPGGWAKMYRLERAGNNTYSYQMEEPRNTSFVFIELAFNNREGDTYILQKEPKITRAMEKAILFADGIPYLAPEIILFYKTDKFSATHPYLKPKMEQDFAAVVPLLSAEQKQWLMDAIDTAYPDGYDWLDDIMKTFDGGNDE